MSDKEIMDQIRNLLLQLRERHGSSKRFGVMAYFCLPGKGKQAFSSAFVGGEKEAIAHAINHHNANIPASERLFTQVMCEVVEMKEDRLEEQSKSN